MSARRLIGIDLAWGERNPSGCVELVREGGELRLSRLELVRSLEEIVEWIEPGRGDWAVAIDAPLVIRNWTGPRPADAEADEFYMRFHAGAYPANLERFGQDHRGGRLLRMLTAGADGGQLVEGADAIAAPRLVFETYPHIVMVELFGLGRIIKYKKGTDDFKRRGQGYLVEYIRKYFCGPQADPRLGLSSGLEALLREPDPPLRGSRLRGREDLLDGLVSAYMAAWLDAGCPVQGLGKVGAGMMIVPKLRGIRRRTWPSGGAGARGPAGQAAGRAAVGGSGNARRIELLIDCENESSRHAAQILKIAAGLGDVVQKSAYADWTETAERKKWAEACKEEGIRQVQVNRTPKGKNTVDNYMSADAARLAGSMDVDAVCLVTSDSDFSGAATVVRAAGKEVYGIGSGSDKSHFARACTKFFRLGGAAEGQAGP